MSSKGFLPIKSFFDTSQIFLTSYSKVPLYRQIDSDEIEPYTVEKSRLCYR